jgi:hypothetical protein
VWLALGSIGRNFFLPVNKYPLCSVVCYELDSR